MTQRMEQHITVLNFIIDEIKGAGVFPHLGVSPRLTPPVDYNQGKSGTIRESNQASGVRKAHYE